jgi:hypothetical protein
MSQPDRIAEISERLGGISAPEWEIMPNGHGDPAVTEKGRGMFRKIADLSTHPADYGRGNMEFIANAPTDVKFLLEELSRRKALIEELTTKKEEH